MKVHRHLLRAAWLAVCALLVLSACGGQTPIAGRAVETVTPAAGPDTPASPATVVPSTEPPASPGSPTAHVSPSPAATATEVLPTPSGTPPSTETPTPPATDTPTPTETPTPVVEIEAGAFTLRQVSIETNSAISNTIAPYVSFDGKFGAPYAGFEGTHGPELFKDRVFQDAKGTIFVLPSDGGDVSQQLAWLEKYADIENVTSGAIKSSEYTPLGKGKVVIVGTGAVFVYPDGNYRTISAPRIVTDHSSQSISNKQMEKFESKFPKIWWSEALGTIVTSDDNDMVISYIYNQVDNRWQQASLADPKNQLKTPEQILTEWRQRIETPGNIVGYTPQEKEKLLKFFDALKYVTPGKDEQIKKIFPWFQAPFSVDFPLRFLEANVQQIINNQGQGIWSGDKVNPFAVKLDILFDMKQKPNESRSDFIERAEMDDFQWYFQLAGLVKEAMTNRWRSRFSANLTNPKQNHYADIAAATMSVAVLEDLYNAVDADGRPLISDNNARIKIKGKIDVYKRQFNAEADIQGWSKHIYP